MSRHPSANLFDLIVARAPRPDKLALETHDATALTYGELFKRSAQAANALVALGVKPGDRVAAQIEKSTDMIVVTLACLRAGAVLLPLNTAYTLAELEYFLGDAEPALTLCRPDRLEAVRALAQALGLRSVESLGVKRDGTFAAMIAAAPTEFETMPRASDDLAAILYTSGTTGRVERRDADARESVIERADPDRLLALQFRRQTHSRPACLSYARAVRGGQRCAAVRGDDDLHVEV